MTPHALVSHARRPRLLALAALVSSTLVSPAGIGCGGGGATPAPAPNQRVTGQSEFLSAPPAGRSGGTFAAGANDAAGGAPAPSAGTGSKSSQPQRTVEETDIYRFDQATNRLYYLNSYRGLMVFDVADVDHPKLLGRSPIYGSPVEMVVRGTLAVVVVADWYGTMADGTPFRGSIVRGLDASDPAHIKNVGEAQLGGWVRDTRVVTGGGSDVLYAVSEDEGWSYGWYGMAGGDVAVGAASPAGTSTSSGAKVIVSSVSFAGGVIKQAGYKEFPGYGGVFNVTPTSIMLAHDVVQDPTKPYSNPTGKTELQYVDISDYGGKIALRGAVQVGTRVQGWGADNGRWHLDFADGKFARVLGCGNGSGTDYWSSCGGSNGTYTLATADFSDPDHPTMRSALSIPGSGWAPAARFDGGRMYLSPDDYYGYSGSNSTPIQVFDVTSPDAPALVGQTTITGSVWNFFPSGNRLFALGNDYGNSTSSVALRYLDVTDATHPTVIGVSTFGDGWAWTPAADTFKAFTKDDSQGLVVLPFSGWSDKDYQYNNGAQLIEFTSNSITTKGAAHSKGWTERGIFVNGRLLSLSDLSLAVVDYSDHANPRVVNEVTLARNVIDARPQGNTIAETSTDWWGNDQTYSELIVRNIADAEENKLDALASVKVDGTDARVFRNGDLAYVATHARQEIACDPTKGPYPSGPGGKCYTWTDQVQVVDLSNGGAVLRGKVTLPSLGNYYGWWGWEDGWWGCMYDGWYDGDSIVQVDGDAIAFRRWFPNYSYDAQGNLVYNDSQEALFVVDLKNADAPSVASTTITTDPQAWWGNMRAIGNTLYTTHYEWIDRPDPSNPSGTQYTVKYYLDRIDLTDRAHPRIGSKINVPGVLVGASPTDPSLLYTIDYRWYGNKAGNDLDVIKIDGDTAYLQGSITIDGWVGKTVVSGPKAYMSAQSDVYDAAGNYKGTQMQLHEVDVTDPANPVDRPSSAKQGWGWLLGIEGDRAILRSGWGDEGIDIYRLSAGAAPAFEQFVRTRGWWASSLARQDDTLFLSSGYWGVQAIPLAK